MNNIYEAGQPSAFYILLLPKNRTEPGITNQQFSMMSSGEASTVTGVAKLSIIPRAKRLQNNTQPA